MNWELILSGANIVISAVITLALVYVGNKTSKIDKLEDKLESQASRLVDERFAVLAAEFKLMIGELRVTLQNAEKRLERGDATFDEQSEAWRKLELKTQGQLGDLRNEIMRMYATREEVMALVEKLQVLQLQVTRFEGKLRH